MKFKKMLAIAGLVLSTVSPWLAQAEETDVAEVKKQILVLTEEIEKLKLGGVAEPKYESFGGLGPAASKVYGLGKGLSIGGYGELVYSNFQDGSKKDFADTQRFILYGGYKFNDWIIMNTELEFEHGGIGNAGKKEAEVYVEFSYLDFLLSKSLNIRTGLMLMPIGLANEYHEPTVFNGVFRPDVETNLIPTTWREMGIMAHGEMGELTYKIALTNGLRSDLFSNSTFIRKGRQQGAGVNADGTAWIANVNYQMMPALSVGGTYYRGDAEEGAGKDENKSTDKKGTVDLYEAHTELKTGGLGLRGLYAKGAVDGNEALKTANKIGKEAEGWYLEASYDILTAVESSSEKALIPFVRYEKYDTNKEVFSGIRDETQNREVITAGINFKPHPNVVLKGDYQWRNTASDLSSGKGTGKDENKIDQVNIGVGFIF